MANFFDQFDGGTQPSAAAGVIDPGNAAPTQRGNITIKPTNFFDQFDDATDPQQFMAVPGGVDAAFGQFADQPAPAPADQQRLEQLASAFKRAPDGQGQAVDRRTEEIRRTTDPYTQAVMQGLTLGFEDEIGAGLRTMAGQGQGYDFNLAAQREALDRSRQESPIGMAAAEFGGSLLSAPLLPGGAIAGGSRLARAGAAARQGAIYGGVYGAGSGEGAEDRATGAIGGAVIGGAAGGVAGAILPGGARAAQPQPGREAALAAERQNIALPIAAASDSMSVQRGGQALANVPFAGNSLVNASKRAIEQTGQAAERVAGEFGGAAGPASRQSAGATARGGIENYIGTTLSGRTKAAYDAVDTLVDKAVTTPLQATGKTVATILQRRQAAGQLAGGKAVETVAEAIQRPQGLTYEGVKDLRSSIGEMLKGGILPEGLSQAELKQIYGSLSDDLRSSVKAAGGPKALAAFERANTYNRLVSERRENLARILKAPNEEGVYERLYRAAGSTATADVKLLAQARKALPKEEWNEVASAVIGRLGRTADDAEFSALRFVSDYEKLSPMGKSILFRSAGKGELASALDDIATVSKRFKEIQRFANPSGSAQVGSGIGIGIYGVADPVSTIGTLLGGAVMSKVLASPATARSMARWARAYEAAVKAPARGARQSFNAASNRFSADIARELGLTQYTQQISTALQGAIADPAENDRVENPRPRAE